MINYLGKEPSRRVFLMGPPGSFRQENAVAIAEHFNWKCITTGDLLRKEVKSKTPEGKIINQRFKAYEFVDDQLVIDIVHKEIKKCEDNGDSWICQGFPRTYAQALSLQNMGILPDMLL